MNKRKIRDSLKLGAAILFFWLYIPHILIYCIKRPSGTNEDIERMRVSASICLPSFLFFLFLIHNNSYYRNIFYHRIGPVLALLIGWWRPGNKYLILSKTTKLGKGVELLHPFATVINADKIGDNFSFRNGTTIGSKSNGRPTLGNDVTLGVNVCIIGKINIGNNVTIGAGSVVTKDLPDNCIAAGNPARIIKMK